MPSSKHVVVVQDLASRFPAAKIVTSTKARHVIPALTDIYKNFGNPENQLSDNGPLFNSEAMSMFAQKQNISLQKAPPRHPQSNPVETFMKPLGKTMKIAFNNHTCRDEALSQLLQNYRSTPHPATGVAPAAMLFRDGQHNIFPRVSTNEQAIENARARDNAIKLQRQQDINSSKYRKQVQLQIGDIILLRNFNKTSKFDPIFAPDQCSIISFTNNSVTADGRPNLSLTLR